MALNFSVPAFTYAGQTFNRIGVVSDGYVVAGGKLTYSFKALGLLPASSTVRTDMGTPLVHGTTTDVDTITVTS